MKAKKMGNSGEGGGGVSRGAATKGKQLLQALLWSKAARKISLLMPPTSFVI